MKTRRQAKILELIQQNNVETQEELSAYLEREGYQVTQATVSRDIRELKLTKIATDNGRQKYAVLRMQIRECLKNTRVFSEKAMCLWTSHRISS